mmetsp:Transcript_1171/g.1746  ORF Transcript_1171/g.1746 Transcript_1171/m.1746 type:complete len:343 (-) Transcript_1171:334-1362(-)
MDIFALGTAAEGFFAGIVHPSVFAAVSWSCCSISMVLLNKLILSTFSFEFNMVLLFYQNTICVISLLLAREMGLIKFESLEISKVKYWLPLNVLFVLMLATGTYSLQSVSVPMVTVFKNSNNILITLLDFVIYRNKVSSGVVASLLTMLLAAVLAAKNDIEFDFNGYTWTSLNCACTAAFVLYMPAAMSQTQLSSFGKVYYNNVISIPLIVALDVLAFGDFLKFYQSDLSDISIQLQIILFMSGIAGFALSLSSFRCMQKTSPTTYSLLGSLNKIPLTLFGTWLFKTSLSYDGILYISLSLFAGVVFAYTKAMSNKKKQDQVSKQIILPSNVKQTKPAINMG